MQTHIGQSAGTYDSASGEFINEKHRNLATVLNDYCRDRAAKLSLVWIPPRARDAGDISPYALVEDSPSHGQQIIRHLSDAEMENPAAVLGWVMAGDLEKIRPVELFERFEMEEKAAELLKLRAQQDKLEEQLDFIAFAARTPLHTFKHDGRTFRS